MRGFAYLLLLVLIAVLSVAASGSVAVGQSVERRAAEEALLVAGDDFRRALASFRAAGGKGPTELAELLRDPRTAGVLRHLRQLPYDPLTGRAEWGLLRSPDGRIAAVYSLAEGRPIKRDGFDALTQPGFEDADRYSQWLFGSVPVPAPPLRGGPS
jgi:type II secretory pathway pseudopilin PulG